MRSRGSAAAILVQVAFRNLFANRWRTIVIGGVVLLGAFLVVVGSSIVESIDTGMRRSIQGSLGGHVQVFNESSKDTLSIYGSFMGDSVLEPIEDFAEVKVALRKVPNVREVVPMGIDQAVVATGNIFDQALERLRADVRARLDGDRSEDRARAFESGKAHVRRMVTLLRDEVARARTLVDEASLRESDREELARARADLLRATSAPFWEVELDRDPLAALEFLENRIAPLSAEGGTTLIRYVGTDQGAFRRAFDRMELVAGTWVPEGKRGALVGAYYAEEYLKLKTAHRLDKIRDALSRGRRIADDEELQRWVRENTTMTRDILLQLGPREAEELADALRAFLGSKARELRPLLSSFLDTTDGSFADRYRFFYDRIAPHIRLYLFGVGDTVTIKAPSKTGYINSVNVKVYGVVNFRGMEQSGLASMMTVLDLMTWRDLYGHLTREKGAELAEIKRAAGVKEISREDAEAALFGDGRPVLEEGKAVRIEDPHLRGSARAAPAALLERTYSQEEIDRGVALNAAVILEDPSPGAIRRAVADVGAAARAAGLPLRAITWQAAAGYVGQLVFVFRLILFVAVLMMFGVALIVINNAMVMAALQRVKELGTMRAIGAQRRFVLLMVVLETVAIGLAFGACGAALGAAFVKVVALLGGIPAPNDQLLFVFSGPALVPTIDATSLALALLVVFVVSVLSGIYPALLAMRITPVQAMASEE